MSSGDVLDDHDLLLIETFRRSDSDTRLDGANHAKRLGQDTENSKANMVYVPEKRGWKKLLAYVGPGFLVAIAYIDPGNFESDLQAGAKYKFELLWVLLVATIAGTLIQSLAANLGVVTVIGTAYALNMLFHLELWVGVLLTGFSTLMFLAMQKYGVRKLEMFISFLVFTIASCFLVEMVNAKPLGGELVKGLFVPNLSGHGATGIAISLFGAMVMPHNLYLHSALVLSRSTPRTAEGIRDGCRYNLIECSFALLVSFAINLAVVSVSGAVCSESLSPDDLKRCSDLDLNQASFLLRNVLGRWSSTLFAIALLASGQSSTITGTYAGQYVMQGFLELRFTAWLRNMLTRCVAILPSLVVALIGGSSGAGKLIIISSMILSFELPFALLPLLKFTSSPIKMGPHVSSIKVTAVTWIIGVCLIAVNMFYLSSGFVKWIRNSGLPRSSLAFIAVIGFAALLAYISMICYLAFRTDKAETYLLETADTDEETLIVKTKEMELMDQSSNDHSRTFS